MKRFFAISLVALLVVACSLTLVACTGGIKTEEDWNKAMEAYLTADALTLKITDDVTIWNGIIFDDHDKEKTTVSFDAKKGIVTIICENGGNNLSGFHLKTEDRYYYVLEGTNVIEYHRYVSEYSNEWKKRATHEFDTVELAMEYLRDQYLHYLDREDLPFVPFTELSYSNFGSYTLLGKRTFEKTIDGETYNYELSFTGGKITKYLYKYKHDKDSSHRKTTVKISYSAKVTLPDDLPDTDFDA